MEFSEARTINLETEQVLSLNPDDYESRVKTTSELLRFLASCFNIEHAAINLDTVAEHPPLIPLLVDILDKTGIDLNGVRFNAANDEEWSYVNNRFGVEVGHYLGRSE